MCLCQCCKLGRPWWQVWQWESLVTSKCVSPVSAEYAQVLRMLGNGRLEAQCIDGIKRLCHIRGKMRKKVWVNMVSSSHHA